MSQAATKPQLPMLKAWAAFFFLSLLLGIGIIFLAGCILGGVLGATQAPQQQIASTAQAMGMVLFFVLPIPVTLLLYWWSVEKFIVPACLEHGWAQAHQHMAASGGMGMGGMAPGAPPTPTHPGQPPSAFGRPADDPASPYAPPRRSFGEDEPRWRPPED